MAFSFYTPILNRSARIGQCHHVTVDKLFVGGVDNMSPEQTAEKVKEAFALGIRLVDEIRKSRNDVLTIAS